MACAHGLSRPERLGRELLPAACARGQVSALVNLTTLSIVRSRSRAAPRRRRRAPPPRRAAPAGPGRTEVRLAPVEGQALDHVGVNLIQRLALNVRALDGQKNICSSHDSLLVLG